MPEGAGNLEEGNAYAMKRLRCYLDKTLNLERAVDQGRISEWGITLRYAPDPPEAFDEFEFGLDFQGDQDVAFVITIENGTIKRMLFGRPEKENPDLFRPLDKASLEAMMEKKGEALAAFFDYITQKA